MKTKKSILALFLLACLLLASCGNPGAASPAKAPAEEAELPTPVSPSPEAELPTPAPAPEEEPESTRSEGPDPSPAEAQPAGVFPLLEKEQASLELLITRNPNKATVEMYLRFRYPEAEHIHYRISDLALNGKLRLQGELVPWTSGGEQFWPLDLGPLLSQGILSLEQLRSFRCHVLKYTYTEDGSAAVPLWEEDCEALIPEGFHPTFLFLPCLGAIARGQILFDNGALRVTLLGLGQPAWEASGSLAFLLRAENRSDRSIPFKVTGLSANGSSVAFSSNSGYDLAPGTACCAYESAYRDAVSDNDITEIRSVEIRMLTDLSEDTGTMNREGGLWYPVDLEGEGGEASRPAITRLLFENEWVRVGLADYTETELSFYNERSYTWKLLVENRSNTDLELSLDREEDEGFSRSMSDDAPFSYLSDGEIRAGGWRYLKLNLTVPDGVPRPDLSIRLTGQSVGGGRLLFANPDPIPMPFEP